VPIGRNLRDFVEARVPQHAHHQVATFVHAAILGRNRGLANPLLKPLYGFIVTLRDLGFERLQIDRIGGEWILSRR
jgi:CobQ-like glutamine amidotransferase family enzyme